MIETPNLDYFNAIAAGDAILLNRLIHIAKEEFPLEKGHFLEVFEARDFQKAAAAVHKLKHKINIFGLDKGYSIAARFENELRQKETHSYSEFLGILDRIETYLTVI